MVLILHWQCGCLTFMIAYNYSTQKPIHEYSMIARCFNVYACGHYACGQVLFRCGSKLVVPSAVNVVLNLTYDHSF